MFDTQFSDGCKVDIQNTFSSKVWYKKRAFAFWNAGKIKRLHASIVQRNQDAALDLGLYDFCKSALCVVALGYSCSGYRVLSSRPETRSVSPLVRICHNRNSTKPSRGRTVYYVGMATKAPTKKPLTLQKTIGYILAILGIIGLLAAFILTLEKIHILKDPSYVPNCNINPVISCGSIIRSPQAEAFGFMNPLIGIFGFGVVTTIGMALLAGATFKLWFWLGLQAGTIIGIAFVHWLMYSALYDIGALCPWCMVVWTIMIPIFLYTTLYNLRMGHIKVPKRFQSVSEFMQRHHGDILVLWYVIIIGLILNRFWYYWQTVL